MCMQRNLLGLISQKILCRSSVSINFILQQHFPTNSSFIFVSLSQWNASQWLLFFFFFFWKTFRLPHSKTHLLWRWFLQSPKVINNNLILHVLSHLYKSDVQWLRKISDLLEEKKSKKVRPALCHKGFLNVRPCQTPRDSWWWWTPWSFSFFWNACFSSLFSLFNSMFEERKKEA